MDLDKQTEAFFVDESSLMAPQRPESTKKRTKIRLREGRQRTKSVPKGVKTHFADKNLFRGLEEVTTKKAVHLDPDGRTVFHPAGAHDGCGRLVSEKNPKKGTILVPKMAKNHARAISFEFRAAKLVP